MLGSLCERISLERRRKMPKKCLSRSSRSCGRSRFCRARARAWQWRARRHARCSENSHRIFFALEVEGPTRGCSALSAANLIKRNGYGATSGNCGIDGLMSVTGKSTRDMGHDVTLKLQPTSSSSVVPPPSSRRFGLFVPAFPPREPFCRQESPRKATTTMEGLRSGIQSLNARIIDAWGDA